MTDQMNLITENFSNTKDMPLVDGVALPRRDFLGWLPGWYSCKASNDMALRTLLALPTGLVDYVTV